ncbi:hypothetical protein BO71DRAFT_433949, partial [Aspergillus ellipticus CBS 707.79]
GDLTFHYARWLGGQTRTTATEVILEVAFWIGPTPGTAPSAELLARYSDTADTVYPDRWIIFHMHIPLDPSTFQHTNPRRPRFYPGVTAMGLYHSQTLHDVYRANPRAEFRFSTTYNGGNDNTGAMRNYNSRVQSLRCATPRNSLPSRWHIGRDSVDAIQRAQRANANLPASYVRALNSFGIWLMDRGLFSIDNLAYIWPEIARYRTSSDGSQTSLSGNVNGVRDYRPEAGAFAANWDLNGEPVDISDATDDWS